MDETPSGWLCIASEGATVRVGDRFNEVIGDTYVWPKTIPQARKMKTGDVIALWDTTRLLGFSVIERIDETLETREQYRCPNDACRRLDMRERRTKSPRFKCGKCAIETENPIIEVSEQESFSATYAAGWVVVEEFIDAQSCRVLTKNPETQHTIRELDIDTFSLLVQSMPNFRTSPFRKRRPGHVEATVRVRLGQGAFRQKLREKYGDTCAMTGPNHAVALEAAHLYSYAEYGEHHEDGGLLLRRDLHRLFDAGLVAVNPDELTLDIHPDILQFPAYANLQGFGLAIDVPKGVVNWLRKHWAEFRILG